MDARERYVASLIRSLVKQGVLTFVGSAASAIAVGPYGFALGPAITTATIFFSSKTEAEQVESMPSMTNNEIVKLAIPICIKLAIENIPHIIQICKDIINILKRLFEVTKDSASNLRSVIRFSPVA